jgi:hypothetical protein
VYAAVYAPVSAAVSVAVSAAVSAEYFGLKIALGNFKGIILNTFIGI